MKNLLPFILAFATWVSMVGQAVNPQTTFANSVNINKPTLWLNFNDSTTSFLDSVSGSEFGPGAGFGYVSTPSGALSTGYAVVSSISLPAMTINHFCVQFYTAPAAGAYTFLYATGTFPTLTIPSSFTVTVAAVTTQQCFTAPTNFTAFTVPAGAHFGYWTPTAGTAAGYYSGTASTFYYTAAASAVPSGAHTYTSGSGQTLAISLFGAVTAAAGTPLQPGFDNTNSANYSGKFTYSQWNTAPNNTIGNTMEWDVPWTMLLHIDDFNWDGTSNLLILASKGDTTTAGVNNNWWEIYLQQNATNTHAAQLCFARNGVAPYTSQSGTFVAKETYCSPNTSSVMPNGFNYDIALEDNGTGSPNAINMWINGVAMSPATTYTNQGFGGITAVVTSGGTGYPTSGITIAASGGGTHCTVTGTANAPSGAITSVSVTSSYGCTSAPTIVITASGGSGAVITATSYPMTMASPTWPLMVPGFVNAATYYGPGGTDTTALPVYVDEFATFPGDLSFGQITNIFYNTKFYQGLVYPGLTTNPPLVIFNSAGCGPDFSGDQTMAMLINAHLAGLIRIIGIDDDDGNANGSNSVGWFRQILDQAGLADVPVAIAPAGNPAVNTGGCPAASITSYNANTDQNPAHYESATVMYRTLFAKYSSTPIYVLMSQTANGYNLFQLSTADGISSLTGLQLQAQNYANGGWVNGFEGNFGTTPSYYTALLNNMGNYPIYFEGGSPIEGGPGIFVARTALDPMYLAAVGNTEDTSQGWTNQELGQLITPYFLGGINIGLSGGTGYAQFTVLAASGTPAYCVVNGYMVSSSGVPSSIVDIGGEGVGSTYSGLGHGCNPVVFTATGVGTNLTVSAVTCCNVGPFNLTPPLVVPGATISGTGVPSGTTIISQTSGPTGGPGVYVTSAVTTATAATITALPTVSLVSPTGTGVTLTVTGGTHINIYEGSGTAQYAAWPNSWGIRYVFQYFQNSLMVQPGTGAPR